MYLQFNKNCTCNFKGWNIKHTKEDISKQVEKPLIEFPLKNVVHFS